jgi:hypothetical protein
MRDACYGAMELALVGSGGIGVYREPARARQSGGFTEDPHAARATGLHACAGGIIYLVIYLMSTRWLCICRISKER